MVCTRVWCPFLWHFSGQTNFIWMFAKHCLMCSGCSSCHYKNWASSLQAPLTKSNRWLRFLRWKVTRLKTQADSRGIRFARPCQAFGPFGSLVSIELFVLLEAFMDFEFHNTCKTFESKSFHALFSRSKSICTRCTTSAIKFVLFNFVYQDFSGNSRLNRLVQNGERSGTLREP